MKCPYCGSEDTAKGCCDNPWFCKDCKGQFIDEEAIKGQNI